MLYFVDKKICYVQKNNLVFLLLLESFLIARFLILRGIRNNLLFKECKILGHLSIYDQFINLGLFFIFFFFF